MLLQAFRMFPGVAQGFAEAILGDLILPSPATLSRGRLYLDVAYMFRMREVHNEVMQSGALIMGMVDSSPQGGRDWVIHECCFLHQDALQVVTEAAEQMARIGLGFEVVEDVGGAMRSLQDVVARGFRTHVFPPTGLGSWHGNIAHKFHAVLHGLRLECSSWRVVQALLHNYFTITTDLGVERKLAESETYAGDLFPYCCDLPVGQGEAPADNENLAARELADSTTHLTLCHAFHIPGTFHMVENL